MQPERNDVGIDRGKLRWNGWGWIDAPDMLGERANDVWRWVGHTLAVDPLPNTPAVPLSEIALPPIRLNAQTLRELGALTSPDRVKTDSYERAFHARGRSYPDMLCLRSGRINPAPDAVVYPASTDEVLVVVRFAAEHRIALVPFGGGSSVVGGVNAQSNPNQTGIVMLDMTLMNRVLGIDAEARVARIEAGIYGPALEKELQAKGFTLSHYPQSFEFSTLGGWIAARGAGHQSNRYGKAEDWLLSATLVTPAGLWKTEAFPASAAGPQFNDLVPGSEGALGVITEAEVRIHPVPEAKDYRGYIFMDYSAALVAARTLMQSDVHTAMIRLSDPDETYFLQALHMGGEADRSARFCLMLVGIEGDKAIVDASRERSQAIVEANGGMHMGDHFGTAWYKGRFTMPYLRDPLMDRGLAVDTLETATRWSNLGHLHAVITQAIGDAMAARPGLPGSKGIVMAHVSHAYEDGASLYFTYVYVRDPDDPYGQWQSIKHAASEAILANGGTISHHHGVGTDHLPYLLREKGQLALNMLRAVKSQVDPLDILNPGKLIPKDRQG